MIKTARINFEKSRENLENKFPDHELPFFLSDLEIIPNFEAKQERKIWRELMKESVTITISYIDISYIGISYIDYDVII